MRGPALLLAFVPFQVGAQAAVDLDRVLGRAASSARLPPALTEASGLTVTRPGSVWTHDDERGVVHRIDPVDGRILETLTLGPRAVLGDFEGLAFDGDRLHLVTSGGTLVSFRPGPSETVDDYAVRETAAGSWCEVEGLEFDPLRATLVLACKAALQEELAGRTVLLEVDRPPGPTETLDRPLPVRLAVTVSADDLEDAGLPSSPRLSGLAYDPELDAWWMVAARERLVLVVDRDGALRGHGRLDPDRHRQAEGIAVDRPGGRLLLVDEGAGARARVTVYRLSDMGDEEALVPATAGPPF